MESKDEKRKDKINAYLLFCLTINLWIYLTQSDERNSLKKCTLLIQLLILLLLLLCLKSHGKWKLSAIIIGISVNRRFPSFYLQAINYRLLWLFVLITRQQFDTFVILLVSHMYNEINIKKIYRKYICVVVA